MNSSEPPISALRGVTADPNRPGQRLLPAYAVKLLRYLKIDFGTDRVPKADIDPTLDLLAHIVECLGVLRDVNKVYRAKGSIPSRSVGARAMFGLTAELGNLLLDAMTFNPPEEMETAAQCYCKVGQFVLNVFPEIAAQDTKATGKVLMHHAALKASESMSLETIQMVHKAYPAGASTADASGALPLHWATHNPNITVDMVDYIITANPKAPMTPDDEGYLPLHWAVNHDAPSLDVVKRLLLAHPGAAATPCNRGSLPLHWCVARDHPPVEIVHELLIAHADAIRTYSSDGCLPMHRCVDRPKPSIEVLRMLSDSYPQALQCPDKDGHLPLHRACDHPNPSFVVLKLLIAAFPKAATVQDDDGYTALHIVLEHDDPSNRAVELLLMAYPDAVSKTTRDGLLPLHCYCANPGTELNVDIAEMLVKGYPQAIHQLAVDIVPEDETADPDTWQGQWLERKWSPYTRVVERRMREFAQVFKAYSNGQVPEPVPSASYLPSIAAPTYNAPSSQGVLKTGERAFESTVAASGSDVLPSVMRQAPLRTVNHGPPAVDNVYRGSARLGPSPRSARSNYSNRSTPRSARSRSSRGSARSEGGPGTAQSGVGFGLQGIQAPDRYDSGTVAQRAQQAYMDENAIDGTGMSSTGGQAARGTPGGPPLENMGALAESLRGMGNQQSSPTYNSEEERGGFVEDRHRDKDRDREKNSRRDRDREKDKARRKSRDGGKSRDRDRDRDRDKDIERRSRRKDRALEFEGEPVDPSLAPSHLQSIRQDQGVKSRRGLAEGDNTGDVAIDVNVAGETDMEMV